MQVNILKKATGIIVCGTVAFVMGVASPPLFAASSGGEVAETIPDPSSVDVHSVEDQGEGTLEQETDAERKLPDGWHTINKKIFYYTDGEPTFGFTDIGGKVYYFDPNDGGAMTKGWFEVNGYRYYAKSTGELFSKGFHTLGTKKYYFTANRNVKTGLFYVGSDRYYANKEGSIYRYTIKPISGKNYFFGSEYKLVKGPFKYDGKRYVSNSSGIVQSGGWTRYGDNRYYTRSSGICYTNSLVCANGNYYGFDANGILQSGWFKIGSKTYYGQTGKSTEGRLYKDTLKDIGGKTYLFTKDCSLGKGMNIINGDRYIADKNGVVLKNRWVTIGDNKFLASKSGKIYTNCFIKENGTTIYYVNKYGAVSKTPITYRGTKLTPNPETGVISYAAFIYAKNRVIESAETWGTWYAGAWVTAEYPTCTTSGTQKRTLIRESSNGRVETKTETRTIPATGHAWETKYKTVYVGEADEFYYDGYIAYTFEEVNAHADYLLSLKVNTAFHNISLYEDRLCRACTECGKTEILE